MNRLIISLLISFLVSTAFSQDPYADSLINELNFQTGKERVATLNDRFKLKHHAINGKLLIEYLEQGHNIDVILMDIKMPEMTGVEATEIISKRWPHIKIVMCTIFDDDEHIFNAILAGASGYLMKDE